MTKYVLTEGIRKRDVSFTNVGDMVSDVKISYLNYHGEGKDWHKTYESALIRAKNVKQRRIDSLNKQIEKIYNLTFPEKEI